jgi:hypothetical protein
MCPSGEKLVPARSPSVIALALVQLAALALIPALPLSAANAVGPAPVASRSLLSATTSQSDLPADPECQGAGAGASAGGAGASAGGGGAGASAGGAGASAGGGAGASAGGAGASAGSGGSGNASASGAGGAGSGGSAGDSGAATAGADGAGPGTASFGSGPAGGVGPGTSSGAGGNTAGSTGGIGSAPSAQQAAECDRALRRGEACSEHGFYSLRALYFNAANYRSTADCLTAAHAGRLPLEVCRKP